nr:hypothetical protein [uncultured Mediterraneibacter sp.]
MSITPLIGMEDGNTFKISGNMLCCIIAYFYTNFNYMIRFLKPEKSPVNQN